MSWSAEAIDALIDDNGWQSAAPPAVENGSTRVRVALADGTHAMVYTHDSEVAARRSAWCHEKEHGAQLFAVPRRLDAGAGWVLVEDVDGVPIATYLREQGVGSLGELGRERSRLLCKGIGQLARKLHEVGVPTAFGDVLETGGIGRWQTFNGYCAARLEDFSERVRSAEGLGESVRSSLLNSIGDLRNELSAFHPRHPPTLNHGHMTLDHIWVDRAGRDVVALTGFDRARLLPREADLATILWFDRIGESDELVRAFYSGYGAARTMDLQRRERFYRRLAALEALVHGDRLDDAQSVEALVPLTRP